MEKKIDIVKGFTFFIKSKIWILYAVFTIIGCANESKPTGDYRSTINICDNLYVEAYTFYATGVYSSEIVGDYLTDSATFRVYVGKFDNGTEGLSYECKGDTIFIYNMRYNDGVSIVEKTRSFCIKNLNKLNNYSLNIVSIEDLK